MFVHQVVDEQSLAEMRINGPRRGADSLTRMRGECLGKARKVRAHVVQLRGREKGFVEPGCGGGQLSPV